MLLCWLFDALVGTEKWKAGADLAGLWGELFDTIFLQFGTRQNLSKAQFPMEDEQQQIH
jgi:hypothetical protein